MPLTIRKCITAICHMDAFILSQFIVNYIRQKKNVRIWKQQHRFNLPERQQKSSADVEEMYWNVFNRAIWGACVDPQEKQPWREKIEFKCHKNNIIGFLKDSDFNSTKSYVVVFSKKKKKAKKVN